MNNKIRTARAIKPGMVIRSAFALAGSTAATYREVATITKPTAWAERLITFTDGTSQLYSLTWSFDVTRSKAQRNAAKARAGQPQRTSALETALALLGAYAAEAVTAR